MDFMKFYAGKDDDGRRLDRILRRILSCENLPQIYKAVRSGLIRLNDSRTRPEARVQEGDCISVALFLQKKNTGREISGRTGIDSCPELGDILFHNEYVLIVNKPYDISVQGGNNSLSSTVYEIWKKEYSKHERSLSFIPGPLHRLDRKTTGILVFSQNLAGAQWFSEAFAQHKIGKKYVALIEGHLEATEDWSDSVLRNQEIPQGLFHTVTVSDREGKLAITNARPIAYGRYEEKSVTFAEFSIRTGRTHQIRSQSAYHGYPLLGDTAYGGRKIQEARDFFLHAIELNIQKDNPILVPEMITAPISTDFEKMLDKTLINRTEKFIL